MLRCSSNKCSHFKIRRKIPTVKVATVLDAGVEAPQHEGKTPVDFICGHTTVKI